MNEMGLVIKRGQMTNIGKKQRGKRGKNDHHIKILDKLFLTLKLESSL